MVWPEKPSGNDVAAWVNVEPNVPRIVVDPFVAVILASQVDGGSAVAGIMLQKFPGSPG